MEAGLCLPIRSFRFTSSSDRNSAYEKNECCPSLISPTVGGRRRPRQRRTLGPMPLFRCGASLPPASSSPLTVLGCWQPAKLGHFDTREIRGLIEVSQAP